MLFLKRFKFVLPVIFLGILLSPVTVMGTEVWTLEKSIIHAFEVSPDIRVAIAEVKPGKVN
ncbi:hypothetical protein MNBD_UNCLBAC01-491 [hydrothermal vent metagenome]|uniref:Uncharacterized protein n=1 Tax=hydrothermal vent metagenome TaxID=652676 RepID=A0A3B1D0L8_9ZZZZ